MRLQGLPYNLDRTGIPHHSCYSSHTIMLHASKRDLFLAIEGKRANFKAEQIAHPRSCDPLLPALGGHPRYQISHPTNRSLHQPLHRLRLPDPLLPQVGPLPAHLSHQALRLPHALLLHPHQPPRSLCLFHQNVLMTFCVIIIYCIYRSNSIIK